MANEPISRPLKAALAAAVAMLCFATGEFLMRYSGRPATIYSGWRAAPGLAPLNQAGLRGRPWPPVRPGDFIVVLSGGDEVECPGCPAGETTDVILEQALHQYNQDVRVVSLGATGYGQDQALLALRTFLTYQRADLVVSWVSPATAVPRNTFRSGQPGPGGPRLKPTFALIDGQLRGPTEALGQPVYSLKFATLLASLFANQDARWTRYLPPPTPGAQTAVAGVETRLHVDDALEEARSPWSVWLTPRPPRVAYGIALTRQLLRRTSEIAKLHGARFVVLMTPRAPSGHAEAPVALEHGGRWFLADPKTRAQAEAEIGAGFELAVVPAAEAPAGGPDWQRAIAARLAETLSQRDLLVAPGAVRGRH